MSPSDILSALRVVLGAAGSNIEQLKLAMAYGHEDSFSDGLRSSEGIFVDFIWLLKKAVSSNKRLQKIKGKPTGKNRKKKK